LRVSIDRSLIAIDYKRGPARRSKRCGGKPFAILDCAAEQISVRAMRDT
jgi:hypothetical protein